MGKAKKALLSWLKSHMIWLNTCMVLLALLLCAPAMAQKPCLRIVSQASFITETLAWLGKSQCIVGVSSYDNRKDLPQTGGVIDPDYKAIANLRPDVVFLSSPGTDKSIDYEEIKRKNPSLNGVKIVPIDGMESVEQMISGLYLVASTIGMPDAQEAKERFEALLNARFSSLKEIAQSTGRVAVLTHCFGHPAIIGRNTFINDALAKSGFSVTPVARTVVISAGDQASPNALAELLRNYWDRNGVSTVILISDMMRPSCVLSGQHRLIPFLVLGMDVFHSPSPRILDDLDILSRAIEMGKH